MFTRGLFAILALVFTGTAAAGAALPGLPAVPFLLAAVACGRRGWPALATRLESHPRWGALLRDWHQHRAVPRRANQMRSILDEALKAFFQKLDRHTLADLTESPSTGTGATEARSCSARPYSLFLDVPRAVMAF